MIGKTRDSRRAMVRASDPYPRRKPLDGAGLYLFLVLLITLGGTVHGQAAPSDGTLVHEPASPAEQARQAAKAAAYAPFPGLNPENKRTATKLSDTVYKISAWPQAGYNYDYYLYLPPGFTSDYLLAISIASGGAIGMGPDYYSEWARKVVVEGNWETKLADGLRAALVYPGFDRPNSVAAQYLSRDAMLLANDRISRLDLQFIAMIEDAKAFIRSLLGIQLKDEVLLAGFSMSAEFAARFTAMHPERVRAAAYGGTSFMHILPYTRDTKARMDLVFPVGVADIALVSGRGFDRDAYLKVPRLLTMGIEDVEDITRYGGLYPSFMKSWIDGRLGRLVARWSEVTRLLGELGAFESKLYRDRGHGFDPGDYVAFLDRYNSHRTPASSSGEPPQRPSTTVKLSAHRSMVGKPEVIIMPTINTTAAGYISSIDLAYIRPDGAALTAPETVLRRIQLQIDVRPGSGYPVPSSRNLNRAYDSPLISATTKSHVLAATDIRSDILMALFISYEDLAGNQYLIQYRPQ